MVTDVFDTGRRTLRGSIGKLCPASSTCLTTIGYPESTRAARRVITRGSTSVGPAFDHRNR